MDIFFDIENISSIFIDKVKHVLFDSSECNTAFYKSLSFLDLVKKCEIIKKNAEFVTINIVKVM